MGKGPPAEGAGEGVRASGRTGAHVMFKLSTVYTSWLQRLHQTMLAHQHSPGDGLRRSRR